MYKVFLFYVFKTCTTHYRGSRTKVFCAKAVIKTLLTGIKADYISTDKLCHSIFREIFQNIKPSF